MVKQASTHANLNLSLIWARSFLQTMNHGVSEISPLVVTVDDFVDEVPCEIDNIRTTLDSYLKKKCRPNCHTVANTIFPQSMWNARLLDDGKQLFQRFNRAWPQLKKCPRNRRGTYFQRLTAYQPKGVRQPINQLEHIINTYKAGNHRRSALQASIFDPTRDHNNCRQLGFPCLHQVAFIPNGEQLTVVGYYATQYMFERAYGNYLGLCRLGRFMADQMKLHFSRMICIASVAQCGKLGKSDLSPLRRELEKLAA